MNFSFEEAACALPRLSGDGESMQDQTAHMSGGLLVLLMQADVGRPCLRAHAVYAVCLSSAHTLSGCTGFFQGQGCHCACRAGPRVCARVLQHLVYQSSALHALVRADADSDDGDDVGDDEEQEERAALIRQNALMVGQCGKTLLPGAWRGCAKSPL